MGTINRTRRMVWTALLSAVAAVLMYMDTALPVFPGFLKMDLSDLPALVAAFAWGPAAGVLTELIKNLIHSLVSSTAWVGELANFIVGSALVAPAGFIYRRRPAGSSAVPALITGALTATAVAALANYYFLLPFYSTLIPLDRIIAMSAVVIPAIHDTASLIIYGVVPFNLFKGSVVSLAALYLFRRIGPMLG